MHNGEDDLGSLASIVASWSSLSWADCYGVIIALIQVIGEPLSEGRIVRIDNLGTFQIMLNGLPADSPADLGKANVKGGNIIYRPSCSMKEVVKQLKYKRIR